MYKDTNKIKGFITDKWSHRVEKCLQGRAKTLHISSLPYIFLFNANDVVLSLLCELQDDSSGLCTARPV